METKEWMCTSVGQYNIVVTLYNWYFNHVALLPGSQNAQSLGLIWFALVWFYGKSTTVD